MNTDCANRLLVAIFTFIYLSQLQPFPETLKEIKIGATRKAYT